MGASFVVAGGMANGSPVYAGAVAMNGVAFGTRWHVVARFDRATETWIDVDGPTYTVADRIGHGSQFDVAMPGDCDGARSYGRRRLRIERVG
jgi:hypothetical protein